MAWLDEARTTLAGKGRRIELCEQGHAHHRRLVSPVRYPRAGAAEMWVYDAFSYIGTEGYCTGDDDVSRTIITTGSWEKCQTPVIADLLADAQRGLVIDFGCHIGWYTLLAAKLGHDVLAIDGCNENLETLGASLAIARPHGLVVSVQSWVDEDVPHLPVHAPPVRLVKVDLEGNDRHAIRSLRNLLQERAVDNIFVEISPVFNDTYLGLIDLLMRGYGFVGEIISEETPRAVTFAEAAHELTVTPQFDMLFRLER